MTKVDTWILPTKWLIRVHCYGVGRLTVEHEGKLTAADLYNIRVDPQRLWRWISQLRRIEEWRLDDVELDKLEQSRK